MSHFEKPEYARNICQVQYVEKSRTQFFPYIKFMFINWKCFNQAMFFKNKIVFIVEVIV